MTSGDGGAASLKRRAMETLCEAARAAGVPFEQDSVPRECEVDTGELTLRYLDWGSAEAPTVLLLHGFAQTAHSWDFVSLALAGKYRVIAPDARGHGDSDWAKDGDYSTEALERDLDALVGHLGLGQFAIAGLSMGGRTAYAYAPRRPESVAALTIVDVGPVGPPGGRSRIRSFVSRLDERDSYEDFVRSVRAYQPLRSPEQVRNTLIHNVRRTPRGTWTWKYDSLLRDPNYQRPVTPPDQVWDFLRRLECPVLLVRGARSDVLPREVADRMTEVIRDCTFAEVERAGHIVPGDNTAGFLAALVPWLERVYPGA